MNSKTWKVYPWATQLLYLTSDPALGGASIGALQDRQCFRLDANVLLYSYLAYNHYHSQGIQHFCFLGDESQTWESLNNMSTLQTTRWEPPNQHPLTSTWLQSLGSLYSPYQTNSQGQVRAWCNSARLPNWYPELLCVTDSSENHDTEDRHQGISPTTMGTFLSQASF